MIKLFQQFGNILAVRFRTNKGESFSNKKSVQNLPFLIAFVYFETEEAANKACAKMNGFDFHERKLKVDIDSKDAFQSKINPKSTIFVGNLKFGEHNSDP